VQAIDHFAAAMFEGMSSMMDSFLDGAELEDWWQPPSPRPAAAAGGAAGAAAAAVGGQ
jgi:hypothetical protein